MEQLTTATQKVATAESNLIAARALANKERRDAAMREVLRIKARLTELKPKLEELAVNTKVATNRRLELHYKIVDARTQIAQWSAPLDIETFTTTRELERRAAQAKRWQARYDQHVAEFAKVAEYEGRVRREAMEMDAEYRALGYSFRNFLAIAEGGEPGAPAVNGGLAYVAADFLTIPGSLAEYPAVMVKPSGMREITSDGQDAPAAERTLWERLA
jgi:hypothetical protein